MVDAAAEGEAGTLAEASEVKTGPQQPEERAKLAVFLKEAPLK